MTFNYKILIIALMVVILAGAGFGVWLGLRNSDSKSVNYYSVTQDYEDLEQLAREGRVEELEAVLNAYGDFKRQNSELSRKNN